MTSSTSLRLSNTLAQWLSNCSGQCLGSTEKALGGLGRGHSGEAKCCSPCSCPTAAWLWSILCIKGLLKTFWKCGSATETQQKNNTVQWSFYWWLVVRKTCFLFLFLLFSGTGTKPHESIWLIYSLCEDREKTSSSRGPVVHMLGLARYGLTTFAPESFTNSTSYLFLPKDVHGRILNNRL